MAISQFKDFSAKAIRDIAEKMAIAAKTAPKGRGIDNLSISILDGEDLEKLAAKMEEIGRSMPETAFFIRDAENIRKCACVVLIGTKIGAAGLKKCGFCGFASCEEKLKFPKTPCAMNTGDLGIAIGSAVSIAADFKIDNRIMFSAGLSAIELGMLDNEVKIAYAIPLSASGKNPFFDRK